MKKKGQSFFILAFVLLVASNLIYAQWARKTPYLIYTGDEKEMQILWQLNSTDTCTIEWGTDTLYTLGSTQTYEYGNDHQHSYTITNLVPITKYYYRITVNQEVHAGTFRSAPDTNATAIKFFAYGDTRTYPYHHGQLAIQIMATFNDDADFQSFIISVGDLVNNGDSESGWDNEFFNPSYPNILEMIANLPYQSCMGNHEEAGVLFQKYFPYPFVEGRYWSFDYGPAHFVVVDQYTNYDPGSTQFTWIENDLASTTKSWKFIYLHEPGWSAGGGHSNNSDVQNYIQPLCEQYDVSIVFGGHNHYYARAVKNGIQHITTGGGGAPLHQPNNNYGNIVTTSMSHHFCKIEIEGDSLNFKAVKTDGTVIDLVAFSGFNVPPAIISKPDTIAFIDSLYQYSVIADDNINDTLIYSLTTAPYWLSIDGTTGLIEGIPSAIDLGDTLVTVRVDDGHGRTDSQTYTLYVSPPVTIDTRINQISQKYALNQNYPNPFNPTTIIKYQIPELSFVTIKIYDVLGNEITTLVNEEKPVGFYKIGFNGTTFPSGIYFCILQANNFIEAKKRIIDAAYSGPVL